MLLGEEAAPGDTELEATYDLWLQAWEGGKARVAAGDEVSFLYGRCQAVDDFYDGDIDFDQPNDPPTTDRVRVTSDPDYTVRAWMAAMSYLLGDHRFIFER